MRVTPGAGRRALIVLVPLLAVLSLAAWGLGRYAYEAYDYVQHDNEFCVSCHLMESPYERFQESAHNELGCKSCHQPGLTERIKMGLTQVVNHPDRIKVHAEVPNDTCVECHLGSDPEGAARLERSAGHRLHLESRDIMLRELSCVECHSTALHEFGTTARTCSQASCHGDREVVLGEMQEEEIECVSCHVFMAPVAETARLDQLATALSPNAGTCMECHEEQEGMVFPNPDPHEGECASCHNAHADGSPHDAVRSCSDSGCHDAAEVRRHFHRELASWIVSNCTLCHRAHDFRLDGEDCVGCHQDVVGSR